MPEKTNPVVKAKSFWVRPSVYFYLATIAYAIFETLNASVVCKNNFASILTGLSSFIGFWLLFAGVILTISAWRRDRKFSWLMLAFPALIVVLFMLDSTFGKTCYF